MKKTAKYTAKTRQQYNISQRTRDLMAIVDVRQQLDELCREFEHRYKRDELADCTSVIGFEIDDVDDMLSASMQLDIADRRLNP